MRSDTGGDPFAGRYLFHLHTTYTDGEVTVRQYFELAGRAGLERLLFLEHIRAAPSYEVGRFAAEVHRCAAEFGLPALVGFEAKLLPGGLLDISPEHAAMADVLGIAEHGFPPDRNLWQTSLRRALERWSPAQVGKPVVWVHPGLWLQKQRLLAGCEPELVELIRHAQEQGVRVERNLRYGLLPLHLTGSVGAGGLVLGADAHRLTEAEAAIAHLQLGP